jgi:hypothetical protein
MSDDRQRSFNFESSSKVVPLRVVGKKPCQDTIKFLEMLLEQAKDGELIGVAVAGHARGNGISTGYTESCLDHGLFTTLGAVDYLGRRLRDRIDE